MSSGHSEATSNESRSRSLGAARPGPAPTRLAAFTAGLLDACEQTCALRPAKGFLDTSSFSSSLARGRSKQCCRPDEADCAHAPWDRLNLHGRNEVARFLLDECMMNRLLRSVLSLARRTEFRSDEAIADACLCVAIAGVDTLLVIGAFIVLVHF